MKSKIHESNNGIKQKAMSKNILVPTDFSENASHALNYAIDEDLGNVISMSFGTNETCMVGEQLWHQAFRDATSKGITLLASSGDSGAAELCILIFNDQISSEA